MLIDDSAMQISSLQHASKIGMDGLRFLREALKGQVCSVPGLFCQTFTGMDMRELVTAGVMRQIYGRGLGRACALHICLHVLELSCIRTTSRILACKGHYILASRTPVWVMQVYAS
jgi:hypothetical protein